MHTNYTTRVAAILVLYFILIAWAVPSEAQPQRPPSPLTLQQAIQYALNNYPAIRAAQARVSAQEAGVDLARTSYLPRFDSNLLANRATRNNVPGLLFPGSLIPPISGPASDTSSASTVWGSAGALIFSWEPFDFGLRGSSVDLARAQVNRANAGAEITRLDVGLRAADAFLRLAAAQETVRAARANVQRMDVLTNSVAVLVQNQLRPGADESRTRAELAVARIQVIQAEQAEQVSRANLGQWLGIPAADVQIIATALLQTPAQVAPAPPIVATHPQAVAQMANVDSVRAFRRVLDRSYFPRFNFQSGFSQRGTGARVNGTHLGGVEGLAPTTPNWAVGLSLTFPLFDFFSIRERKRIEEQNERAEVAIYDRVVQELNSQVEQARAETEGARRVAENTPIQLESARVLEQQSGARYQAGLATIVELADAQRLLLQAEVGDAVARISVWRALLAEAAAKGDLSGLLK
ncbi:MAG: TolC family protein [Acidobacteria bacterium]|nr:TolC family protein [Acidobacteriota bacterium]